MTELARTPAGVSFDRGFGRLRAWADALIADISSADEAHLVGVARGANEMEAQAFRIRGACAAEMKRRIRERVEADPSQFGKGETAVVEQMRSLAREIGVAFGTLQDDCRIFEEFGDEILAGKQSSREVYRLALCAKDPRAALAMWETKKACNAAYSKRDFWRDLSEAGRESEPREQADSDSHTYEVRWELTRPVLREMHEMSEALACDHELAVSYAIRYAAKALREGLDIRSRI